MTSARRAGLKFGWTTQPTLSDDFCPNKCGYFSGAGKSQMNATAPLNFVSPCSVVASGENLAYSGPDGSESPATQKPISKGITFSRQVVHDTVLTSSSRGQHVFESV